VQPNLFPILAREQSLGESYALILHERSGADPETYKAGLLAYAEAKAAFDALIESAKNHLIEGRELAEVEGFRARVAAAVARRLAFTDLVGERLLTLDATTKGIGDALDPAKWVKTLVDAVIAFLKERRAADETRRQETLAQLDGLKWKAFGDLIRPRSETFSRRTASSDPD
jgi:hypothetical protein